MTAFYVLLTLVIVVFVNKIVYDHRQSKSQAPAPPDAPGPNGRKRR